MSECVVGGEREMVREREGEGGKVVYNGRKELEGMVIIGATNFPESLDK